MNEVYLSQESHLTVSANSLLPAEGSYNFIFCGHGIETKI